MGNSNGAASALCCGDTRGSAGKHLLRQAKTPDDRLKSTLRKQVVSQRRSSARKYQQSVLNPQLRYDPSEDAETDEETLPEVVKEDDHEITIELITAMLSGCKVRFDKACKYHPGNEEGDHEKFHTWLRRTKTAFRRTAYLCRIEIEKLGPLDPARLQFVQKQSDSYRYLAVLFNELTPRVKSAAANLAKAAVLMRSVNQLVEEEKLVKQALGLCVEPRLRDWPAALGHAQRLAELRKTPQRQADVQLFEHLVESGSKTAVVSYSKATGSYQVGIVGEDGGGGGAAGGPSFQLRPPSTGSNKSGKGKTGPQKIDGPQKLPPLSAV